MLPFHTEQPWSLVKDFWTWAKLNKGMYFNDRLGRSWVLTTDRISGSVYWIGESDTMRQLYLNPTLRSKKITGHFFNEHEALTNSEIYKIEPVSCEDCLNIKELTDKYLALSEILISSVGENWLDN